MAKTPTKRRTAAKKKPTRKAPARKKAVVRKTPKKKPVRQTKAKAPARRKKVKTKAKAPARKKGHRGPDKTTRKKRQDNPRPPRPGPGRPKGSRNTLPMGSVAALRTLNYRVPADTPEELAKLANEGLVILAQAMLGKLKKGAFSRVQAVARFRHEVCGPLPQKVEVTPSDDLIQAIYEGRERVSRARSSR